MTKEELYFKCYEVVARTGEYDMGNIVLDEFFDSNVCIPKGKNRHPYADVLHEWVEGGSIEWTSQRSGKTDILISAEDEFSPIHTYRIKPSEPVYEYQWLEDGKVQNLGFYLEDELEDYPNRVYQKLEVTKRVRNA